MTVVDRHSRGGRPIALLNDRGWDAAELRHLPHEVVPSARLLARIGCTGDDHPSG